MFIECQNVIQYGIFQILNKNSAAAADKNNNVDNDRKQYPNEGINDKSKKKYINAVKNIISNMISSKY